MSSYQRFIAASRYARFLPEQKRRETWKETVTRFCDFFKEKHPDIFPYDEVFDAIYHLEVMPSMRALMTAGKALDRDNVAGYNCSYIAVDDQRAFDEALYILMCFAPETTIKTRNGNIPISKLTCDDEVLSFNIQLSKYEYVKPANIIETPSSAREKIELEFEDGTKIQCTSDHKFFTENRGWVEAKDLTDEDNIKNYHELL